ncbi:P-loop NTPase [Futiania mangrovi]|uniref:P-loop NTPase n=1 Tax=Futiania mangrovi TaxID=2959716 RepID=A0A9J6PH27_9PROT|nr:P-loop NTPase [Futiania mangrovii]MCP1335895.1 P-loop NTPase [Futiania mangrovii]
MSLIDRVAKKYGEGKEKGSLVERTVDKAAPDSARTRAAKPAKPIGAPPAAMPVAETPAAPAKQSSEFVLDFTRLREGGFITPYNRRSRVSEEFRLIKRRLMQRMALNREGGQVRARNREHVILVTSARPGEGKSFNAVNLALSIVLDEGFNVLLVDADVARPSLSKLFNVNAPRGLTDLLGQNPPDMADVLLRERNHPLSFLPAGTAVASATDLFGSPRMNALMDDIADRYTDRIIIFDGPPLLASTEPVVLAQHVGQIVFVVDSDRTSRNAVESALDLLDRHDNVNLVLNKASAQGNTDQFGSYYDAYNRGDAA